NTGHGLRYDGYDLSKVGRALLAKKNQLSQADITGFLERFPPLLRARVVRSLGFNLAVRQVNQEGERGPSAIRAARIDLDPLLAPYSVTDRAEIARGAGIAARFLQFSAKADLSDLLGLLSRSCDSPSASSQPYLLAFLQGAATPNPTLPLASPTAGILAENGTLAARGLEGGGSRELAQGIAQGIARGDGFLCGGLLRRGIASDVRSVDTALRNLPAELRPSFFRGLGSGCAEGREEPGLPDSLALPQEGREEFWRGFAETLRDIHGADAPRMASRIAAGWTSEDRAGLERAIAGG
ncbi:MAG TPA: hypothetical protein VKF32_14925, partial [Thermoanaerobaculia bacterium]|nr:hypothetical protein [Thermoanaerobaculia bacterium]